MKNIIEVSDISRHYNVGKQIVKALDSISVNIKKMSMYPSWVHLVQENQL